jgi:hypothetical protein
MQARPPVSTIGTTTTPEPYHRHSYLSSACAVSATILLLLSLPMECGTWPAQEAHVQLTSSCPLGLPYIPPAQL